MLRIVLGILLLVSGLNSAFAAIKGEPVEYKADGVVMKGYLAYDDSIKGKRPGVLVVHEWWGHNEYTRMRARMLAELGYIALAVDMYGDGTTADNPDEARKLSSALRNDLPLAKARFEAALNRLKKHSAVDSKNIAAIGSSFGCHMVLEMARLGEDLRGVVCIAGNLTTKTPAKPGRVKAKVLVLNGADDPMVSSEQIVAFKKEMETAGVDYRVINYVGAKHSFANPDATAYGKKYNLPLEYNAQADKESQVEIKAFFKRALGR